MMSVKVQNMSGSRIGKPVPNQFVITTDEGTYFQSYDSVIAFKPHPRINDDNRTDGSNKTVLDGAYWDYSTTTGKYRNQFLGEDKAATQKKINAGEYVLANLNDN